MKTYTVTQAAAALGLHPRTVRERCEREEIGRMVTPRMRILSAGDLELVRKAARPRGNPNW